MAELVVHPVTFFLIALFGLSFVKFVVVDRLLPMLMGKSGASSSSQPSLTTDEYRPFKLVEKRSVSHNTRIFRFALPTPDSLLGLPVGKHIVLRFTGADGKHVSRQYTPITSNDTRGYFELLIKVYPNGKMSTYLDEMTVGSTIEVRGPMGMLEYQGAGRFRINHGGWAERSFKRVGMICGGTGITPMYQVATHILAKPSDTTELSLVFANVNVDDILLRDELDALKEKHSTFHDLYYVLNNAPDGWKGGVGFVSADMIRAHVPAPAADTLVCLCGPTPMTNAMQKHLLDVGHSADNIFVF